MRISNDKINHISTLIVNDLNKRDDFDYKTEIVTNRFREGLEGLNIKLSYPSSNNLVTYCLNITINKESNDSENLKVLSNFHCVDIPNRSIESILDNDWLKIILNKLVSFDT